MDASGLVVSPGMVDATPIFLNRVVATGKVMKLALGSGKRRYHHHDRNAAQPAACTVDRASIELKFDAAKGKLTMMRRNSVAWCLTTSTVCMSWRSGRCRLQMLRRNLWRSRYRNDFRDVNDWQFFKGAQKLGDWDSRCWCTAKTR